MNVCRGLAWERWPTSKKDDGLCEIRCRVCELLLPCPARIFAQHWQCCILVSTCFSCTSGFRCIRWFYVVAGVFKAPHFLRVARDLKTAVPSGPGIQTTHRVNLQLRKLHTNSHITLSNGPLSGMVDGIY